MTFTVPSGGADATIDVTANFRRTTSGTLAVGYFIQKDGAFLNPPRLQAAEVTGVFFPATLIVHDGSLTPGATVTYSFVASKLSSYSDWVSGIACDMTVTLDNIH